MAINSISSGSSPSGINPVTPPVTPPAGAVSTAGVSGGVSVEISKLGQLRSDLSSLAQSDPAQFKAVTADIAQKLKDAAAGETGSRANFLNKLAGRFDGASQNGDASDLSLAGRARGHHHHGGHHHGRGGGFDVHGDDGGASVSDVVQGIISGALGAAAGPSAPPAAPASGPASAPAPGLTSTTP